MPEIYGGVMNEQWSSNKSELSETDFAVAISSFTTIADCLCVVVVAATIHQSKTITANRQVFHPSFACHWQDWTLEQTQLPVVQMLFLYFGSSSIETNFSADWPPDTRRRWKTNWFIANTTPRILDSYGKSHQVTSRVPALQAVRALLSTIATAREYRNDVVEVSPWLAIPLAASSHFLLVWLALLDSLSL